MLFVQFPVNAASESFLFIHLKITERLPFLLHQGVGCSSSAFPHVVGRNDKLLKVESDFQENSGHFTTLMPREGGEQKCIGADENRTNGSDTAVAPRVNLLKKT